MSGGTKVEINSWIDEGRQLARAGQANSWQVSDWLVAGKEFGDKQLYKEAAGIFGLSYGTLRNMKSTADAFPLSRRRDTLSL